MAARKRKRRTGRFVLDCSVTVAWFFEDEADAYAESVEDTMDHAAAEVPSLWPLEVANCAPGRRAKEADDGGESRPVPGSAQILADCHRRSDDGASMAGDPATDAGA